MLEIRLLGQFDVRRSGEPVIIPSRPAQSLFAYLVLHPGIAHRRESLAGLLFPDSSEENARSALRHALWRIRKAIEDPQTGENRCLLVDEISIAFKSEAERWLDTAVLEQKISPDAPPEKWMNSVSVYTGELLPGFYDDWVILERERLRAVLHNKMKQFLDRLVAARYWEQILDWGERWISFGQVPEPAYAALMIAHANLGDLSSVRNVYRRCEEALRDELGVEPAEQTRALFEQLIHGEQLLKNISVPALILPGSTTSEIAKEEAPEPGEPPYKGLKCFEEADAALFFGRELLTAQLVAHICSHPFLAVIGASGSGKSSIVRAGLIPALKLGQPLADGSRPPDGCGGWQFDLITPTAHPLQALAVSLTRDSVGVSPTAILIDDLFRDPRSLHLAALKRSDAIPGRQPDQQRSLLVVDQFEEVFTLCRDEPERQAFIDNLMTAASEGVVTVVIALRADFYANCGQYARLRQELAGHQEYIGAMSAEELRRTIEEPAKQGGWIFEPGLVDLLIREVVNEPGALPLLSHALLETWKRRRGRSLLLVGYAESGGVSGAISRTAESLYQRFTLEQQQITRQIFLRLTQLGEGTPDTHRRATLAELNSITENCPDFDKVLQDLADARLIIIHEGSVEVAHDALIREWPTLREWLVKDREGLRLHRSITEKAQKWEELERDPDELIRGGRLAQALEWREAHTDELNALEQDYLDAARVRAEGEAAEHEAQRQRELEAAQRLAESERQRAEDQRHTAQQLRRRAFFLTGAFVLALIMAAAALYLGNLARQSAAEAQQASRIASSREFAAAAITALNVDPELSILLAQQAVAETYGVDRTWTVEAENALHTALQASRTELSVGDHQNRIWAVAYHPQGSSIATAGDDGMVRVWDVVTGRQLQVFATYLSRGWHGLAFSPDGNFLAAAAENDTVVIWNLANGLSALTLSGHTGTVSSITYNRDGSQVLTGSGDGTAILWDSVTGVILRKFGAGLVGVNTVAISPDGKQIAAGGVNSTITIWDAETAQLLQTLARVTDPVTSVQFAINGLSFSPDGRYLAAASDARVVDIWDAATGKVRTTLRGHTSNVNDVVFLPDGIHLASASSDGTAVVWNMNTGQETFTLRGHADYVISIAVNSDGTRLATGSLDGTARIWNAANTRELFALPAAGNLSSVVYDPAGTRLAAGAGEHSAKVWDASSGRELLVLNDHTSKVLGMAFSPDGKILATASDDHTAILWDASTGVKLRTLLGHESGIMDVAFSPDGTLVATGSLDNTARLWNAQSGDPILVISGKTIGVHAVAFSPDGKTLATASADGTASLWDISDRTVSSLSLGKELVLLQGHSDIINDIAFSPDGSTLVTASDDGTVKLWDPSNGREIKTLGESAGGFVALAFSPNGERLTTASRDGQAKVWNLASGREQLALSAGSGSSGANGVVFSPDGTRMAASNNEAVGVFLLKLEDLAELARQRVTRSLSTAECQRYLHQAQCPTAAAQLRPTAVLQSTPAGATIQDANPQKKACLVTDITGVKDGFFSEITSHGVQAARDRFHWNSAYLEPLRQGDYSRFLNMAISWNCEIILVTLPSHDVVKAVAEANPRQKFQIFDFSFSEPVANLRTEIYAADQAAFLAGYLAASVTKTGKVGTFGGFSMPQITDIMDGFSLGVAYYNQMHDGRVEVLGWDLRQRTGLFTGTFEKPEEGFKAAKKLLDQGADIILPVAGSWVGAGAGYAAVNNQPQALVIGVDSDWAILMPDFSSVMLTSIEKRLDESVLQAVQADEEGKFTGGVHVGTLENGGVGLSGFHELEGQVSAQVRADLDQIRQGIIAGRIKTLP